MSTIHLAIGRKIDSIASLNVSSRSENLSIRNIGTVWVASHLLTFFSSQGILESWLCQINWQLQQLGCQEKLHTEHPTFNNSF